jgi:hypothetical protein
MLKKIILALGISFSYGLINAQPDSSDFKDHSLYLYRTEDDFFNKNKIYRGQYIPSEDTKIIKYETANSKRRTLNLEDSCTNYFAYQIGDEIQIRPDRNPRNFTYYTFGGGNKDVYCVVYGKLPNYDKKGYLLGLTAPGGLVNMYFVDKVNHLNMVPIHEFLKSKPKLLEQYKAEKEKSDKQDWERKKLFTGIKYLKLYVGEQK